MLSKVKELEMEMNKKKFESLKRMEKLQSSLNKMIDEYQRQSSAVVNQPSKIKKIFSRVRYDVLKTLGSESSPEKINRNFLEKSAEIFSKMAKEVFDWDDEEFVKIFTKSHEQVFQLNLMGNASMPKYKQPGGESKKSIYLKRIKLAEDLAKDNEAKKREKQKAGSRLYMFAKKFNDMVDNKKYSQIQKVISFWQEEDPRTHKSLNLDYGTGAEGFSHEEQIKLLKELKIKAVRFQNYIRGLNLKNNALALKQIKNSIGEENFEKSINGFEYIQILAAGIINRIDGIN